MTGVISWLALLVDAVLLAAVELLYLPLRIGAVPFPITILLAAVSTPWLVRSAARLGGGGLVTASPLLMWVLSVLVLGLAGPGGDVLLSAHWRSLLLLGGGMLPGAVALGRALSPLGHSSSPVSEGRDADS
ncbi:MAG: hypothetical protein M3308_00205 [Actinomycetota bacterium]|nr:hypothetical protein [Actinomycetota bacterium]